MPEREPIPPGSLEMLILSALERHGRLHGFEIAEFIRSRSEDVLQVEEGSLYPALQRLLLKTWIAGEWGKTDENRRARYYTLTPRGRKELRAEAERYRRISTAIARVLGPA